MEILARFWPGAESAKISTAGVAKEILIEFGTYNQIQNQSEVVVDNPGTLTLFGENGAIEKVNLTAGICGIFNEYHFPSNFMYKNDATRSQVLKFQTRELGQVYLSYICNYPNSLH